MFKLKVYSQFHCQKKNSSSFFSSFLNIVSLKLIQINSIKVFYLDIIILLLHNYARAYRAYHHYHSITQNYHTLTLIRAHNDIRTEVSRSADSVGRVSSNPTRLTSLGCGLITRQQHNTSRTDYFLG